jgi:hypothetical protein
LAAAAAKPPASGFSVRGHRSKRHTAAANIQTQKYAVLSLRHVTLS